MNSYPLKYLGQQSTVINIAMIMSTTQILLMDVKLINYSMVLVPLWVFIAEECLLLDVSALKCRAQ